jgi:hypothetical protein
MIGNLVVAGTCVHCQLQPQLHTPCAYTVLGAAAEQQQQHQHRHQQFM